MTKRYSENASHKSFKETRRRPLSLETERLVKTEPLIAGHDLPLLVQPAIRDLKLPVWAANNRDFIQRALLKHGGLLLRHFKLKLAAEFEQFIAAIAGPLLRYDYRSTPRSQVEGRIYTSTEYPADQTIPLHNEMSYARMWPMKIGFFCVRAAAHGGETPLADSRQVTRRISPQVTERFMRKQVMYVRNYGEEIDLPWRDVFQTNDTTAVESYCQGEGIEIEWGSDGRLRTRQICPAVAEHPRTGERLWFNQAHLFHVSSLAPKVQETLLSLCPDSLPRNAYYGDGSPIEESVLGEIREAYRRETVTFPWLDGDILLLDNMLTAHGRLPFAGLRQVLVGMAEAHSVKRR
ncbi:MAG TPA: TauD/TfdA family dioxygenase [Pyrinomonadaceae bacterium]|nr:TauD/TfdA family dioxygenase [Pyrinomonadaceae bacterium]